MSIRADEAPNAARCAVLPMSSSAHHRICASVAVLPRRARIVSVAHCRTPLRRIASALPVPLPRTGDPKRHSESRRCGCIAAELHAGGSAVFGADQVAGLDPKRIEKAPDIGRQLFRREAVVHRRGRCAEAGQVGPDDAIFAGQMRHPLRPRARRFGVAVDHHDGFGRRPRRAEPIVLVGHVETGAEFGGGHASLSCGRL